MVEEDGSQGWRRGTVVRLALRMRWLALCLRWLAICMRTLALEWSSDGWPSWLRCGTLAALRSRVLAFLDRDPPRLRQTS